MNYAEGTYVSQVFAESEVKAIRNWISELDTKGIEGFTETDKQNIIKDNFTVEDPILMKGCRNIWCFGVRTQLELAIVNFVKTVKNDFFAEDCFSTGESGALQ